MTKSKWLFLPSAFILCVYILLPAGCITIDLNDQGLNLDAGDSEKRSKKDTGTDADADGDADADTDADTDTDMDADTDTEADTGTADDTEFSTESESHSDPQPDSASDTERGDTQSGFLGDTGSETTRHTEILADTLSDEDADTDTPTVTQTPPDTGTGPRDDTDTPSETQTELDTETATPTERPPDTGTGTAIEMATSSETEQDTDTDRETETSSETKGDTDTCPVGESIVGLPEDWRAFANAAHLVTTALAPVSDGVDFGEAWRCETASPVGEPVNARLLTPTVVNIQDGDNLLATFWLRCVQGPQDRCRTGFYFEQVTEPRTTSVQFHPAAEESWTLYQVPFTAVGDLAADNAQAVFRLGYDNQIIEIYPVDVKTFGSETPPECLPRSPGVWETVEIVSTPKTDAVIGVPYKYYLEYNAEPPVTVTVEGLPPWLSFDGIDLLSGSPRAQDTGTTASIIIAIECSAGADTQMFDIDVQ